MMRIKTFNVKVILIAIFGLLTWFRTLAQTESYIQTLSGQIKPKDACKVVDEKFSDPELWKSIDRNTMVRNLITFELRYDTSVNFFAKPFTCELVVDISYKDSSGRSKKINDVKLDIAYDTTKGKPYKGIAYYKFKGGHEVELTVKSIESKELKPEELTFLRIKNQIFVDREYKAREDNILNGFKKTNSGSVDELQRAELLTDFQMRIFWEPQDFPFEQYDLEYTFYDNNSLLAMENFIPQSGINGDLLREAFKNNGTRVSINQPQYFINLVYPQGYLLVRIRSYKYEEVDGEMDRIESDWHYSDIDNATGYAVYQVGNSNSNYNWQYNAVFAEEGKRKEVVSYFDGTLKSRQVVTINNSNNLDTDDDVAIVQESIYDKLNRPAVNVLPVPIKEKQLRFYDRFNLNDDDRVYSYTDFAPELGCVTNARPMNINHGASKYYSIRNPFIDHPDYPDAAELSKDIPDAHGYPFSVTEFTNDLTGRVRRQGGVGPEFQLGQVKPHETVYYYGKPAQEELDRIFGSEAGAANHYSKNMVVDGNGQVSISYVDMAGKTVATALAGGSPKTLASLPSLEGASQVIKDELISPQGIVRDAGNMKLSFNTTVLVPSAAAYKFQYEFHGRTLELLFGWNPATNVCADCYYDVRFSIADECGNPVSLTYEGVNYTEVYVPAQFDYGTPPAGSVNTDCAIVPPVRAGEIIAQFLKTGEYKVSYELLMSRKALDFYMEYIKQVGVVKSSTSFIKEYLQQIDLEGCFSDCRDCLDKLGDYDEFLIRIRGILEAETGFTFTNDDLEFVEDLYDRILQNCEDAIENDCSITDGCKDQRRMMLKDLNPGGQYMLYDENTLLFRERNINVFVNKIKNVLTATEQVIINRNGTDQVVYLRDLQESEVISNWNPEWAYLMLKYHPEACFLAECEMQSASKLRDKKMMQTDDEVEAATQFGWNANNYSAFVAAEVALVGNPYSQTCVSTEINNKVNIFMQVPVRYLNSSGQVVITSSNPNQFTAINNISLKTFVKYLVYCENKPPEDPITHQFPYIDLTCIPADPQCDKPLEEWRIFRNLYIALKQAAYRKDGCKLNTDCKNCFIGVNAMSSLYMEEADPAWYPKLSDFVIEPNAANTGLILKYKNETPIHNRCNVYISKAVPGVTVGVQNLPSIQFTVGGPHEYAISNVDMNQSQLYFIDRIVNNYNHIIDGVVAPVPNCPRWEDFEIMGNDSEGPLKIRYIGAYPLLNKVSLNIKYEMYDGWGCDDSYWKNIVFQPFETGPFEIYGTSSCDLRVIEYNGNFCVPTPASCISDIKWPNYFQKTRRFYETSSVDDINTVLQGANDGTGGSPMTDPLQQYQDNCTNMAEGWIDQLSGCGFSTAQKQALKDRLIAICVKGSDQTHPYGSSTTPSPQILTSFGHHSFKQAIEEILGSSQTPVCNDFLIDYPLPYNDNTPLNDELVNELTQCGYDLLTRFKNEWCPNGNCNPLYHSLQHYIQEAYDPNFYLTDVQIQELIISFNSVCPLKRPIRIPGLLTRCDNPATPTCLTCSQLYVVQAQFQAAYPQFPASLPNYYDLLAAHINRTYQMNVGPSALHSAIEGCIRGGTFNSGNCNDSCARVIASFQKFFQIMPQSEYTKKVFCGSQSVAVVQAMFEQHMTAWLNKTLGWNYTYAYYDEEYFDGCAKIYYFPPDLVNTVGCNCTPANAPIDCCDNYQPFETFRQWYPNPIDPQLLAIFFEIQNYRFCKPTNLPLISSGSAYNVLTGYFSSLVPNVIPYCSPNSATGCNASWTFTFAPSIPCGLYNSTNAPFTFALCSQPLSPLNQSDSNDCIKEMVHTTLANAEYAYNEYVNEFMRDYREAYFAKCMSITPSLLMEGSQEEYHYTLYYYDQSGNLVKTVPPKGVQYLTPAQIQETGRLRDEDNASCYKNATAPTFNNTSAHSLDITNDFYPLHKDGPLTVESWIRFDDTDNEQIIFNQFDVTSDGRSGYYAYIRNHQLYFEIYGRSREKWSKNNVQWLYFNLLPNVQAHYYTQDPVLITRYREFGIRCNTQNPINTINGSNNGFYHIVFQYSGDPTDLQPVKIYINGVLQTLVSGVGNGYADNLGNEPYLPIPTIDAVRYDLESIEEPFTTSSLSSLIIGSTPQTVNGISFNSGLIGDMKHLRIYNAAPEAADLRRSSYDECFLPASKDGLVLWLPLNKTVNGATEDVISGNEIPINAQWANPPEPQYPFHRMPTYYAYNSLNKIIYQETPDAGRSAFWYDKLGRLVASQNAEQLQPDGSSPDNRYSYTLYDGLGRIIEVGEKIDSDINGYNTQNNDELNTWYSSGRDRQVTRTIYDEPDPIVTTDPDILLQQLRNNNSRKRVATSIYQETKTEPWDYNFATHYVYDIAGNVKKLYQENRKLANDVGVFTTKTLEYDYDLASGKVNQVLYQKDMQDQYLYKYSYDADNRILNALSGRDQITLRQDARYIYHLHGPLARTELANEIVQGVDYAYTLQGWFKGINGLYLNHPERDENFDLGSDGDRHSHHRNIPRDVFAYTLGYFPKDYLPINDRNGSHPITRHEFTFNTTGNEETGHSLYNGNIAYTTQSNKMLDDMSTSAYSYRYDQLNRLVKMRSHRRLRIGQTDTWNWETAIEDYAEDVTYDANGNILTYGRNAVDLSFGVQMDMLQYNYQSPDDNNKLNYVHDEVDDGVFDVDVDRQNDGNYRYDKIGNLIYDQKETISQIEWTVYGKIRRITKDDGTWIEYGYDPAGNRTSKTIALRGREPLTTFYFRDAQGNTMGTYDVLYNEWMWKEQHLYGSTRLGMWLPEQNVNGQNQYVFDETMIGSRQYEIKNHLDNVMAVITDKISHINGYPEAEVIHATDYYPFGMQMPGRDDPRSYRYGFNGKEKDDEVKGVEGSQLDYGDRIYDPRIGRWLSLDPLQSKYPNLSPYIFTGNNPVLFIDYDGNDFGVRIDHNKKTIVIVSNVYTTSKASYNQAKKAAKQWNKKSATVDGYSVTFQMTVHQPSKGTFTDAELKDKRARAAAAWNDKVAKENSNVYAGLDGSNSKDVSGEKYVGGTTENGSYISMNNHDEMGDMGKYDDLVAHEFGHIFGLDDEKNKDGTTKPYYGGKGGIMEYNGTELSSVSDEDVKTVLKFAKDALDGKTKDTDAKVKIIEQTGDSDGKNPLGVKNVTKK